MHHVDSRLLAAYVERPSPWRKIFGWGLALLMVTIIAQEGVGMYLDRRLTTVAEQVTGRSDLDVRCRRLWDELFNFRANPGFVEWGSTTANLQLPVCIDAVRWEGDRTDSDKRVAIMILTHELAHLVGHRDESVTECVSMWAVPRTAIALGGTLEDGERTARWYAAEYNPLLRGDYQAPGCLAGPRPTSALLR